MTYGGLGIRRHRLQSGLRCPLRAASAALLLSSVTVVAASGVAAGQVAFSCSVTGDQDSVVVSWTDIGAKGYDVLEDDQRKRWVRKTTTTDRSPGTTYSIVAFGNGTDWTTTSCDNPNPPGPDGPDPEPFACTVTGDQNTVTISWTDIGANGYDLVEDERPKRWITATSTTDTTPGTSYHVTAFGNGNDWTTTSCDNPNPPDPGGGEFSCTVTGDQNIVVVSWTDIGANGFDVIEDDQAKRWIKATSITDSSPGLTYTVVAFGNGTDWTTASCDNPNPPDPDGGGGGTYPNPGNPNTTGDGTVRLLAAGDIAVCSNTAHHGVGAYVESRADALFMPVGDIAYPDGSASDFANCYDPHFGDAKERTVPVVGNHEYYTAGATGYIDYFGAAAGPADQLYYSVDIDDWHIVVLNGECWRVGGCGVDGPQYQWLQQDLAANNRSCILAAWHQAYFTSESTAGDATYMQDYFALLDSEGTDILLGGHSHGYERFHRMNSNGQVTSSGIRPFVVGTGGTALRSFAFVHNGSVIRDNTTYGVTEFRLGPSSYTWEFIRTSGGSFTDEGYGTCA